MEQLQVRALRQHTLTRQVKHEYNRVYALDFLSQFDDNHLLSMSE